jgi:small subunit ribosomal protein S6
MALYEHVFLARQDISQAQADALSKEYATVIEEGGGKVGKTEYWGLRSIAFKIKKNRKAHYLLMNLDAPAAAVAEMERRMGLSTDVIRFITVRVEAHETEPSVQMRKSDRDDRGERGERGGFRGERGGFRGGFRGAMRGGREGEGGGMRSRDREGDSRHARGPRPPRDSDPSSKPQE